MKPEKIINTIKFAAPFEGLRGVDVVQMQRYFLSRFTNLIQKEIADLTGCERSTVAYSVRRMKGSKFNEVRESLEKALVKKSIRQRGYYWLKPEER